MKQEACSEQLIVQVRGKRRQTMDPERIISMPQSNCKAIKKNLEFHKTYTQCTQNVLSQSQGTASCTATTARAECINKITKVRMPWRLGTKLHKPQYTCTLITLQLLTMHASTLARQGQ